MTDISTHFTFHHKIFSMKESYFTSRKGGSEPYFCAPMGEARSLLRISALREEFQIATDSDDGRLLDVVEGALKYVKVIRVNDAIPTELLDGSASWSVEDRHPVVAKVRLTQFLVAWVTGKSAKQVDLITLARELESPQVKQKVRESIEKLAVHLEIAKNDTVEVERRIDTVAHELSYIEALRERLSAIHRIEPLVVEATTLCQKRLSLRDSVERVPVLLTTAFKRLDSEFDLLDQQNQNIVEVLADVDSHVALIRAVRDDIHSTLKVWDELVEAWMARPLKEDEAASAALLATTHRFLAENYPIVMVW